MNNFVDAMKVVTAILVLMPLIRNSEQVLVSDCLLTIGGSETCELVAALLSRMVALFSVYLEVWESP